MIHLRDPYIESIVELNSFKLFYESNFICDCNAIEITSNTLKGFFTTNFNLDIYQDKTYTILINYNNTIYNLNYVKLTSRHRYVDNFNIPISLDTKYEFKYEHIS
ncbi:MAG: hypothetical protein M0R17_05305 [Candidatus Omnitrophica bacterium]|nr:hypothetical protein [Candidatus Omnitrophota bacterium]